MRGVWTEGYSTEAIHPPPPYAQHLSPRSSDQQQRDSRLETCHLASQINPKTTGGGRAWSLYATPPSPPPPAPRF